ncbi:MAG: hypothetical protein M1834_002251 [Cirrosporium novae-zelandiae]|nr:MAG: hypothetical protein M1834_002251 [Cirrosporium novae-zelandiae]
MASTPNTNSTGGGQHPLPPHYTHHAPAASTASTQNASSSNIKRDLVTWWKQFTKTTKKEDEKINPTGIFGVPLQDSIQYANVAISLVNEDGRPYVYGYVPIVVAKCGVFLKERATDVQGIFRLSGSSKRIKDLQIIFDSPDRYGKGLDWDGYTVHDAAAILRRYLNQLPEPIIPLDFYDKFREPLKSHQKQAVGNLEAPIDDIGDFDRDKAVFTYQRLIQEVPGFNRQLLLYILDLLAVFASKSDQNLMNAANLSAIFQPGILSHPDHDMAPEEYRLSQDVLIFLIENQDNFIVGMPGTAADEKTIKDIESGPPPNTTPPDGSSPRGTLGRSGSTGSGAAEGSSALGRLRRNVSVSSKGSNNVPSPRTPSSGIPFASSNVGVHRSNTVPSKKSPALSSTRFTRPSDPPTPNSPGAALQSIVMSTGHSTPNITPCEKIVAPTPPAEIQSKPISPATLHKDPPESRTPTTSVKNLGIPAAVPAILPSHSASGTPNKERKLSSLFNKSPTSDNESKEKREPNKLRKRRLPGSANVSAQSSTHSLQNPDSPLSPTFHTPMATPGVGTQVHNDPLLTQAAPREDVVNSPPSSPPTKNGQQEMTKKLEQSRSSLDPNSLKPTMSPTNSTRSRTSFTDQSDLDQLDDTLAGKRKKKKQWRFSSSHKSSQTPTPSASSSKMASNANATTSMSSVGSTSQPRKSFTNESQHHGSEPSTSGFAATIPSSSLESLTAKEGSDSENKKGPFGWFKAKVAQRKEDLNERKAEKDRARSPFRENATDPSISRHSLTALMQRRGKSMDLTRDEEGKKAERTPAPMSDPGDAELEPAI